MEIFNHVGISSPTFYKYIAASLNADDANDIDIIKRFAKFFSKELKQKITVQDMMNPDAFNKKPPPKKRKAA